MTTYELYISDIVCPACTTPIENALKACLGVSTVNINIINKTATVTTIETQSSTETINMLRGTIDDIGYTCNQVSIIKENASQVLPELYHPIVAENKEIITEIKSTQDNDHSAVKNVVEEKQIATDNTTAEKQIPTEIIIDEKQTAIDSITEEKSTTESITQEQSINSRTKLTKKTIRHYWIKGIIGILSGAALLAFSIWGMAIPFIALYVLGFASTLLTFYLGKETYKQATVRLHKTKTLGMEFLFTVSTLIAIGVSCVAFFIPWLPMMFDAALLILGCKNIGKAIEESVKHRIAQHSFRSYAPRRITLQRPSGTLQKVSVSSLKPSDIIFVYSGQTIPVNGLCLTKNTTIYNTRVTGRTLPQPTTTRDTIYAGSVVPGDVPYIRIQVTAKEDDSYLALLDRKSKEAEREKARLETATTKILQYFIPTVFAIAAISALIVGICFSPIAAIQCGIAVLVSACPCTLGLITPLAIKTGLAKAAENGVIFKSGKSIESASQVDTVVFDLNGTLTTGVPKVIKSMIPENLLGYLAAIEKKSDHPIAKAIYAYISQKGNVSNPVQPIIVNKSHHTGIAARIAKDTFVVGNSKMMALHNISIPLFNESKILSAEHIIYFAKNKQIVGYILLQDPLREDAKATIDQLKKSGKKIHLCTGADYSTAKKYADQLGILQQNIKADCIGESHHANDNTKTRYIRELTAKGYKVAMIGDAGNDAPAVAASHFGIAMQSSASDKVTQDKAGAVIHQNSLWPIANAFSIASQTVNNIKQNLAMSISYNLLSVIAFSGLLVAIGFVLNPALGALLMVIQTGLILMNVNRFKRQPIPVLPSLKIKEKINQPHSEESTPHIHSRLLNQNKVILNRVKKPPTIRIPNPTYKNFVHTKTDFFSKKATILECAKNIATPVTLNAAGSCKY